MGPPGGRKGRLIWKRAGKTLLLGAVALGLWLFLPPAQFLLSMAIGSTLGTLVMSWQVVRNYRKERAVTPLSQYLAILTPAATLFTYIFVSRQARGIFVWIAGAAVIGLVIGTQWSRTTALYWKGGRILARQSGWWLAFWALSLAVTQSQAMLGRWREYEMALAVNALSSGIAIGSAASLLQGMRALRAAPVTARARCPNCGHGLDGDSSFCDHCGRKVGSVCPHCRQPLDADARFCDGCGKPC